MNITTILASVIIPVAPDQLFHGCAKRFPVLLERAVAQALHFHDWNIGLDAFPVPLRRFNNFFEKLFNAALRDDLILGAQNNEDLGVGHAQDFLHKDIIIVEFVFRDEPLGTGEIQNPVLPSLHDRWPRVSQNLAVFCNL